MKMRSKKFLGIVFLLFFTLLILPTSILSIQGYATRNPSVYEMSFIHAEYLDADFDGHEDDPRRGQFGVYQLDEPTIVAEDLGGRLATSHVVVSGVEDDELGRIRQDDAVGEMNDIGDVRAAEATIDHGQFGKRLVRAPHPNAGAAHKENRLGRHGVLAVRGREAIDLLGKPIGIRVRHVRGTAHRLGPASGRLCRNTAC